MIEVSVTDMLIIRSVGRETHLSFEGLRWFYGWVLICQRSLGRR